MKTIVVAAAGIALVVASDAAAQYSAREYAQRRRDLVDLAEIFGELHQVRRACEPRREAEIWRERMKAMVRLEQPTPSLRNQLVAAFNKGYRNAASAYPSCSRDAEDFAAARASEGETITARLIAPLRASAATAPAIGARDE